MMTYLLSSMSVSPLGAVYNVRELSVGIAWDCSGTLTDNVDHFLGVKLEVFESNYQSRVVRLQEFRVPLCPVVSQRLEFSNRVILDTHTNRILE